MSAPTPLLDAGTEVLFIGFTGKGRCGVIVGLAAAIAEDDPTQTKQLIGYAVKTRWEVRAVPFEAICAPFGDGCDGLDIPEPTDG